MEQRYQDLALLAMSRLAEKHPGNCYKFSWNDQDLVIAPAHAANGHAIVTSNGVNGDSMLVAFIEKAIIHVASGNDAREIGYAHGMAGKQPIEGAPAAYRLGYELARENTKTD